MKSPASGANHSFITSSRVNAQDLTPVKRNNRQAKNMKSVDASGHGHLSNFLKSTSMFYKTNMEK